MITYEKISDTELKIINTKIDEKIISLDQLQNELGDWQTRRENFLSKQADDLAIIDAKITEIQNHIKELA